VVGEASNFQLTNCRIVDFNAHLKVNADLGHYLPADGLVENNEFFDSHPRHTDSPVAPVNIDNSQRWVVRGNLIHDFQKDGSGEDSYGAFVKGGSEAPVIEQNVIECASGAPPLGHSVGLSFGAHGMDRNLCPPAWDLKQACDPEVSGGIIRNNIIGDCSGDGIYLNKARNSKILFNTLVRTGGIEFRYSGSTGVARGNLMTGAIFATDGGNFNDGGNATGLANEQEVANFHLKVPGIGSQPGGTARLQSLPGPDPQVTNDYCGRSRGKLLEVGAQQYSQGPCPSLPWPR